jgi:large subunit ribosomal protein L25
MIEYQLNITKRTVLGNKVKTLRREGIIPGVIYGHGIESRSIQFSGKEFLQVYKKSGKTHIIELLLGKIKIPCIIQDFDFHPVKNILFHVDFLSVKMDEKVVVSVPVVLVGESKVVKEFGALLNTPNKEIDLTCLPNNIPDEIKVDISKIQNLNDVIYTRDLVSNTYEFLDLDVVLASVNLPSQKDEDSQEIQTSVENTTENTKTTE